MANFIVKETQESTIAQPSEPSIYEQFAIVEAQLKELGDIKKQLTAAIIENTKLTAVFNGSKTITKGNYKITATQKLNRTIDGELLQDVAKENGISDCLNKVFKWKPSVVAAEWKQVDEEYQDILAQAFTESYGKVSIKIKEVK